MSGDHDVGYRKPPNHARFRKGTSGNPRGRPKGTKNLSTDLAEEFKETILLREGTTELRISKQRAMLKSLLAKAIKGDTRAAALLLNAAHRLLDHEGSGDEEQPLSEDERAILDEFEQRVLRRSRKSGGGTPPAPSS